MKEQFRRRRRLPHLDKPGAIYFVTSCLEGSIPALGLKDIADYCMNLATRAIPHGMSAHDWERHKWKLGFARSDHWLDSSPAVRHLENHELTEIVEKALLHFAGDRYALWAWVVMPSHFHWVFEPLTSWVESLGDAVDERTPRERVMHSVKRFSSRQCNLALGQTGKFWQEESYDHCIDDIDELERIVCYVEQNPVKASLVAADSDYRFSSAYYRRVNGIAYGRPLVGTSQLTAFG